MRNMDQINVKTYWKEELDPKEMKLEREREDGTHILKREGDRERERKFDRK